jgi:hypothetical protein
VVNHTRVCFAVNITKLIHGILVICVAAPHNGDCEESTQCNYSNETECRDGKCQCKTKFKYDGARCVRRPGMYVSNNAYVEVEVVLKW